MTLFEKQISAWRFHATLELLGYRLISSDIVEYLLLMRQILSNIFCIIQLGLYRVATYLRQNGNNAMYKHSLT